MGQAGIAPTVLSKKPVSGSLARLLKGCPVVKVPGPASPFITHETASSDAGTAVAVSRGKGIDKVVCLWTHSDGF